MGVISGNTPITAGAITAAVGGILAAFTELTTDQVAAVVAVVAIVAAVLVQKFGTVPKPTP
jgi:hypothetical protein